MQTIPDEWMWAQPVDHPDIDALVVGIENLGDDPPERERRLRRLLWWHLNGDVRRSGRSVGGVSATIREKHERANLHRLLELFEDDESQKSIERAEILRELGRFDEARAALALVSADVCGVAVLAAKIDAHDREVCITHEQSW